MAHRRISQQRHGAFDKATAGKREEVIVELACLREWTNSQALILVEAEEVRAYGVRVTILQGVVEVEAQVGTVDLRSRQGVGRLDFHAHARLTGQASGLREAAFIGQVPALVKGQKCVVRLHDGQIEADLPPLVPAGGAIVGNP